MGLFDWRPKKSSIFFPIGMAPSNAQFCCNKDIAIPELESICQISSLLAHFSIKTPFCPKNISIDCYSCKGINCTYFFTKIGYCSLQNIFAKLFNEKYLALLEFAIERACGFNCICKKICQNAGTSCKTP